MTKPVAPASAVDKNESITIMGPQSLKKNIMAWAFEKGLKRKKRGKKVVIGNITDGLLILLKYAYAHRELAWAWHQNGEKDVEAVIATSDKANGK